MAAVALADKGTDKRFDTADNVPQQARGSNSTYIRRHVCHEEGGGDVKSLQQAIDRWIARKVWAEHFYKGALRRNATFNRMHER
jgi:hypothetical protein